MTPLEKLKSHLPRHMKVALKALLPAVAKLSLSKGSTPTLLVIGVQKAATTTLSQILKSHPRICQSTVKEVHYFDLNYHKGMEWYRGFFTAKKSCQIRFEATPYYFFHPLVPMRVHAAGGAVKFIVILRDPVERAYSHFQMERRRGQEPLQTFEQAIAAEPSRIEKDSLLLANGSIDASEAHQRYSYLSRGEYEGQFQRWFQYFSKDQFLVLDNSLLTDQPEEVCQKIADFLHIDNAFHIANKKHMSGEYEPLKSETRTRLREHFRKKNPNLSTMLGTQFEWLAE